MKLHVFPGPLPIPPPRFELDLEADAPEREPALPEGEEEIDLSKLLEDEADEDPAA